MGRVAVGARRGLGVMLAVLMLTLAGCGTEDISTPGAGASPTPGPTERFQSPRTLESYRYTLNVQADGVLLDQTEAPSGLDLEGQNILIETQGDWVAPDNEFSSAAFSFGVIRSQQETIRIDQRVWSRSERGAWRERAPLTDPEQLVGQDIPLTPDTIFGSDRPGMLERLTRDLEARPHTRETINSRETRHWTLDDEWFDGYADDFEGVLPGISRGRGLLVEIDVWTDVETGVGTRLEVRGAFEDRPGLLQLEMNLFDLNEPSIIVEQPAGAIGQ